MRVRRRGKVIIRTELAPVVRALLELGTVPVDIPGRAGRFFITRQELEAAWREHGASLLVEWIQKRPGSRPRGWWDFDAPAPRLTVPGTGELESEAAYLRRLHLLGREERRALPGALR